MDFGLLDLTHIIVIALIALLTSIIHGATGVAGGFLLSAAIAPIIGVVAVVPVISISLLLSHSSRAFLNRQDFDKTAFLLIALPATPCIIAVAFIYGRLSSSLIAAILGCVILLSIPLRRWAQSRRVKTSKLSLSSIAAIYGGLSGVSIGPGMLLAPFMMGYGLTKEAFVATLAAVALLTNITRTSVYGASHLLSLDYVILGLLVGIITIPGNWIGRIMLKKMTSRRHAALVDILTIIGAINFFWLSIKP